MGLKPKWLINKPTAIAVMVIAAVLLASVITILFTKNQSMKNPVAVIYQDRQIIATVPLDAEHENFVLELPHNRIAVHDGKIGVEWADCPDQICVHTGFIDNGLLPIVCLPNKVEIRILPYAG